MFSAEQAHFLSLAVFHCKEPLNTRAKLVYVAALINETGFFILHRLLATGVISGDDRSAGGRGFEQHIAHALTVNRRMDRRVRARDKRHNVLLAAEVIHHAALGEILQILFIMNLIRLDKAEQIKLRGGIFLANPLCRRYVVLNALVFQDSSYIIKYNRVTVNAVAAIGIFLQRIALGIDAGAGNQSFMFVSF